MNKEDSDAKAFGVLVRERRKARGWSQEALAGEVFSNVDRKGYISRIENGKIPNVTRETVKNISRVLKINPDAVPLNLRWPESTEVSRDKNTAAQAIRDEVKLLIVELRERGSVEGNQVLADSERLRKKIVDAVFEDFLQRSARYVIAMMLYEKDKSVVSFSGVDGTPLEALHFAQSAITPDIADLIFDYYSCVRKLEGSLHGYMAYRKSGLLAHARTNRNSFFDHLDDCSKALLELRPQLVEDRYHAVESVDFVRSNFRLSVSKLEADDPIS